ncbi:SAR1 [Enterospora canceri]|uniref:Small COPII coat GTPase SAR1 n=1 Tax=Enterospora canceri TaxID=1081671 RepID=A0A1Y1S4X8_9MICR|nr:SAR1 [Enterospora canceri]
MASKLEEIRNSFMDSVKSLFEKVFGKFVSNLFGKPANILFLGIDNSGKTTLVSKLKNNTNHVYLPTKHMVKQKVEIGNLTASIFDIGGHAAVRIAWKDYFYNVDGIVFIVDVADDERFDEVREAFETVTSLEQKAPILVLMNKIDMIGEDVHTITGKYDYMQQYEYACGIDRSRPNVHILYLSILTENTYDETSVLRGGFTWLSQRISEEKEKHK